MPVTDLTRAEIAELLPRLCHIARLAGNAILEVYATDFDVRVKADASPVTEADERAEAIILAALRALTPDIPIVSEEQASATGLPRGPFTRFWLVDPLDGTREFLKRNGEFTVNIALIERDRTALGVVHVPVGAATYAGGAAVGATCQRGDAAPRPIFARAAPDRGAVVVYSRSHGAEDEMAVFSRNLAEPTLRVAGSSMKFCLLATGEADFYPRFGTTMEWDTAAGQAVLEAAGGRVMTRDGERLSYQKAEFRNPHFIAEGAVSVHPHD
jgi:3'(2'), 5'-bisphosphate nucleotidase